MSDANSKRNIAIKIAYDGTLFFGFQKTKEGKSIEEEIETALKTALRHEIEINAASRTDRGVHAKGQVATFKTNHSIECNKLQHILNCLLPKEIRILNLIEVPSCFHPTLDAIKKEYEYSLSNKPFIDPFSRHYTWHHPYPLRLDLMREATPILIGEKDFIAFQNSGRKASNTIRNLESIEIVENEFIQFTLTGNSFLYKMVRNIVGTLVYIGLEKISLGKLKEIIENRDRRNAGMTAPALGLTLNQVFYEPSIEI